MPVAGFTCEVLCADVRPSSELVALTHEQAP